VCSRTAVVLTQRPGKMKHLSLRNTAVLADRGWTDSSILAKLCTGHFHKYGSWMLLSAIFLNVLGMYAYPHNEPTWLRIFRWIDIPSSIHFSEDLCNQDTNLAGPYIKYHRCPGPFGQFCTPGSVQSRSNPNKIRHYVGLQHGSSESLVEQANLQLQQF
jgi:hypothetical protein